MPTCKNTIGRPRPGRDLGWRGWPARAQPPCSTSSNDTRSRWLVDLVATSLGEVHTAARGHVTRPGGGQLPSTGFSPAHLLIAGLLLGGGGLTMLVGARSRVAALAR